MSHGLKGYHFQNWAKTYSCRPKLFFEPRSYDEIRAILADATDNGCKVRVVGGGHSPSDISCTPDYMIGMQKLNRLLSVDVQNCTFTAEAGIKLGDLVNQLADRGLALSVLPSIVELTLAGALCTATHGTGINYHVISQYALEIELMKADGTVIKLSKNNLPDVFAAAQSSLGALGVILSVTMQAEPLYYLEQRSFPDNFEATLAGLKDLNSVGDYFRFVYYPHTDYVVRQHMFKIPAPRKSEDEVQPVNSSNKFWDILINYHLFQFLYFLAHVPFIPAFLRLSVAFVNRLHYWLMQSKKRIDRNRYDRIFTFDCLFSQYVMEWAVPIDEAFSALQMLRSRMESEGVEAHFPIEVRFTKADNVWLSPCYGRDTCYINVLLYRPYGLNIVKTENYWRVLSEVMLKHQGRPHLAKDHFLRATMMKQIYPKFEDFSVLRDKMDPNKLFLNSNLMSMLSD